jgi:myo-inositol-1(or 4)-monophosphatase
MALIEDALEYAASHHEGQMRKMTGLPYILHPLEAAVTASTMTTDEEVIAAALLHDTVEDTDATLDDIRERFGERVAFLVGTETEDKMWDLPREQSWKLRKSLSLKTLKESPDPGTKVIWISDKLSNIRGFYREWKKRGIEFFDMFNMKDPKEQKWYYMTILSYTEDMKNENAWMELKKLVDDIFEGI